MAGPHTDCCCGCIPVKSAVITWHRSNTQTVQGHHSAKPNCHMHARCSHCCKLVDTRALYNIFICHNGNTQTAQTTQLQMKQRKTETEPTAYMHTNTRQSKIYKTKKGYSLVADFLTGLYTRVTNFCYIFGSGNWVCLYARWFVHEYVR